MPLDRKMVEFAARCHREKWEFAASDAALMSKAELRATVARAFDILHAMGDDAIKASKPD